MSTNFAECQHYTNFKWPYFCTAWGYGHMVRYAGSPILTAHTDVTLTWSKVNVTDFLNFWKLHFSASISSAILAWRSQLVVDYDSMGSSLQLFGARFLNFSPSWRSRYFEVREMLISPESTRFISALPAARSLWLWLQVGCNKPCTLAAMTVSPLAGLFFITGWMLFLTPNQQCQSTEGRSARLTRKK